MTTENTEIAELDMELAKESSSHVAFFLPILRSIALLDGRARKKDVVAKVRELLANKLTAKQFEYLKQNNRYGWARMPLKRAGLLAGERGWWELTALGHRWVAAHSEDEIEFDLDIPDAKQPARSAIATESVAVTGFKGYRFPLLKIMATGLTQKKAILESLGTALSSDLLPGDKRIMPSGHSVWEFRSAWALSDLGKEGHVENTGSGLWAITGAGRERLQTELESWDIKAYQTGRAKVRLEGGTSTGPKPTDLKTWTKLRKQIPKSLFDQLDARLRPDLGATPDETIPRNIILYGPPGTGKTFLAKAVARALTGEGEVEEDGQFRLVQFHPSYAYEDFIQGLRPDIKQTQLRYQLQKGPFIQIAEAAAQQPDVFFVLVIDEINRGDPARIFGELMYALEYRDEAVSLALGGELIIPSNLVIIGTMNSVDRSVALVDYALRRRFGFVRVDPQPEVISEVRSDGILAEVGPVVLEGFNKWVGSRLGKDHTIGHSFFLSASLPDDSDKVFDRLWRMDIQPLLEEYFFGDEEGLAEARTRWNSLVKSELKALAEVKEEENSDSEAADDSDGL